MQEYMREVIYARIHEKRSIQEYLREVIYVGVCIKEI